MAAFDANQWYQINLSAFDKRSMVGQPPQPPNTTGSVFFKLTDNSADGRRWQLCPVDDTRYILRSQLSSPDIYLAIQQDAGTTTTTARNLATMRNVKGAQNEIFWEITRFQNGGYMLVNVANGTNWHLHAENSDVVSMTNNITGEQDNQKFYFTPIGSINNATFSSVQLPSGAYTSLASASSNKPSSGLAQTTKIAIGVSVGVGILVLIGAIVGVCFILRRRRKKQPSLTNSTQFDKAELDGTHIQSSAEPVTKDRSKVQELAGQEQLHELGNNEQDRRAGSVAELPAGEVNDMRYRN